MTLHAAENIGDAFTATREFLTPIEIRTWAKLAVVVFFLGAGTSAPTPSFDISVPGEDFPEVDGGSGLADALSGEVYVLVAVGVAAVLTLALLWGLVGSIMEFVFIESLRNREVTLRRYWGRRWRQGLRLFGFRLALGLFVFVLVGGWLALVLVPVATDASLPGWSLGLFLLGLPVMLVVALGVAVVYLFTTVFVVPLMIAGNEGVLAAWRRLWPSVRGAWKQYLAYALFAALLTAASGLVVAFVLAVVAFGLVIPLAIVGLLVVLTVGLSSTAGLAVLGLLAVAFVVGLAVAWALVQVPVVTYLRYYALLVLGDIEPGFDLVPDQRAAIRRTD